ncbi:MAG: SWIM zinc finger family protein [Bacillus sp. (in: Bacteria)]|nr:SWIM zinc finger family protein [Bacillus sp. (in: firmicutes)]
MNQQIKGLADELGEILHPHVTLDAMLIQKGLMLYRQGLVTQLHIGDEDITAIVQDVMPVKVHINPNFLAVSTCACPEQGLCRHQLAVFFSAYSRVGSVTDWVETWREPAREQKSFSTWGMQTARDLIKANGVLKPDYSRWVHSFEVSFDTLLASKKYASPFVIPELFGIYERRIHASSPVEQEWRLLYELVGIVVSFKKLAALSEQLGHSEDMVKRAYLPIFHNLMDDAEELALKIGVQSLPFAFDEFIVKLKDDAFDLLTCASKLQYERVFLYRLLWVHFFKKKPWREEEIEKINAALKVLEDWQSPAPLLLAGIHVNLLHGNDENALQFVGHFGDEEIAPYMVYWIDYLTQLKAWRRVGLVIELFLQKVKVYLDKMGSYQTCVVFVRNALRSIGPYCSENDRVDLYERAMLLMLPYSFADYEYLLFERGQYERWGELQAFVGLDFYDLPKDRVKMIEREQPEVLLAMLHQTAQYEIAQKNRPSYRMAVRHLKKLRTLYKKLKRVDDWQYFLDTLLYKNRRLRAFHEECRRSKLIE